MDFALNNTDTLDVEINDVESLDFDLSGDEVLEFTVFTPHALDVDVYDGDYEVTPKTYSQTLETAHKLMQEDVTILEIPYFETSNDSDGLTVYIANTIA